MDRIVVGVDGSDTAIAAAREAARYAAALGAELHLVTAFDRSDGTTIRSGSDEWRLGSVDAAEALLSDVEGQLAFEGTVKKSARHGEPADIVIDEATACGATLIVVGNRRVQGVGRVLGSVATAVLRHAPCGVLVVKTT